MPSPLSYVLAEPLLAVLFVAGDDNSRYGVDSSDEDEFSSLRRPLTDGSDEEDGAPIKAKSSPHVSYAR